MCVRHTLSRSTGCSRASLNTQLPPSKVAPVGITASAIATLRLALESVLRATFATLEDVGRSQCWLAHGRHCRLHRAADDLYATRVPPAHALARAARTAVARVRRPLSRVSSAPSQSQLLSRSELTLVVSVSIAVIARRSTDSTLRCGRWLNDHLITRLRSCLLGDQRGDSDALLSQRR